MSNLFRLTEAQMSRLEPLYPRAIAGRVLMTGAFLGILSSLIAMVCAGATHPKVRPRVDTLQPLEAVERQGRLRSDDAWLGGRGDGSEDRDDRRDPSQGAPHDDQPESEKGDPGDQRGRLIGRTKGGTNTKLHAVTDAEGRPIRFFMTARQVSDYKGAAALLAACRMRTGCWQTAPMISTGSEKR